jgi:hypothetical protein
VGGRGGVGRQLTVRKLVTFFPFLHKPFALSLNCPFLPSATLLTTLEQSHHLPLQHAQLDIQSSNFYIKYLSRTPAIQYGDSLQQITLLLTRRTMSILCLALSTLSSLWLPARR